MPPSPPPSPPFKNPALSQRAQIDSFLAMDVMREAKELGRGGHSIIHLEVGEPGSPSPRLVREAAMRALELGTIRYTEALGLPALREAIAKHYHVRYGVSISPERVVITTGSSSGFILAFLALFEHGGRIAIPRPGYPAYRNILKALGVECVEIANEAGAAFSPSAASVLREHQKKKLDGVLVMSPANPTGVVMPKAALAELAQTCQEQGLWLVSDEIYHGLNYTGADVTALQFSQEAIIVNSFSKYFCMTGWRVGWLIVPERLVRPLECLAQNLAISVPYLSQVAAIAAFDSYDELELIKAGYARNRAILAHGLEDIGLPFLPMDGAFYAYCDISRFSNDAMDFSRRALHEAKVALTPGLDFDNKEGNRAIRLSYAGQEADIIATVQRLKTWLK